MPPSQSRLPALPVSFVVVQSSAHTLLHYQPLALLSSEVEFPHGSELGRFHIRGLEIAEHLTVLADQAGAPLPHLGCGGLRLGRYSNARTRRHCRFIGSVPARVESTVGIGLRGHRLCVYRRPEEVEIWSGPPMRDASTLKPIGSAHCPQYKTEAKFYIDAAHKSGHRHLVVHYEKGGMTVRRSLSLASLMIGARRMSLICSSGP